MEVTGTADLIEPPDTDPNDIAQLWKLVEESTNMSTPSRIPKPSPARELRPRRHRPRHAESPVHESTTSPAPKRKGKQAQATHEIATASATEIFGLAPSGKSSRCSVRDSDFWNAAMKPANVTIVRGIEAICADHFGIADENRAPMGNQTAFYHTVEDLDANNIWVDTTERFCEQMSREFSALIQYEDILEPEYERSCNYFFKFELRDASMAKDRKFRTEATPQGSVKPDMIKLWTIPPILSPDAHTKEYLWDLRPDLIYWLSLNGFSPEYTWALEQYTHVRFKRKLSPYCTVEYKRAKDTMSEKISMNQMAASSLIALWNRFDLRKRAIKAQQRPWQKKDMEDMKHYGVRVQREAFDIWVMTATMSEQGEWEGARLKLLRTGELSTVIGVEALSVWLNEIHRWGLSVHAKGVEADVKACAAVDGIILGERRI